MFLLMGSGFAWAIFEIYWPKDRNDEHQVEFVVAKGAGVKEIGRQLKTENLIRNAFWFKVYVWHQKQSASLQAGRYILSPNLNIPQVVAILNGGRVARNEIQITFPEGFTLQQIKTRLIENGLGTTEGLEKEAIADYQLQYKFLGEASAQASLEGFLFPDTYRFDKDAKKEDIIKKFLDNFDKKLDPKLRQDISRQGRKIYEVIILASIVQQEALGEEEMPMLAGIFWNRLKRGMLLQSDATVNYATGKKLRQPTLEDTKAISPFNTYLNLGLPPVPIANPGLAAIRAAVHPQQTEYLYFLHPLGSGAIYAKTVEEHNINKAKYLK